MIIYEVHQMLAPVYAPLFRAVLAVERMGDFKEIHAVKAGIDALVAFIIGTAVQHFVIDDQVIVAKEHFSNQGKSRFALFTECAETSHKVVVQAVCLSLIHICITPGKAADLVLLDQDLNVRAVYVNGRKQA